jgi:hypothetical protein
MASLRDLIVQANAQTRDEFTSWCLICIETPYVAPDNLMLAQQPPMSKRVLSWFDNPALDDDLRLRHLMKDAAFSLNKPYDRHKHQHFEDTCFAKLQALVEAQDRPLSFEEWQILRYRLPIKFREFDALFQRAASHIREEFAAWCIEAWAKPSVVEMLYRALLNEQAQALEDESDWLATRRLGQGIQQHDVSWIWQSIDMNIERNGWPAYYIHQCACLRLVAFNDALVWHHNILIDDEGFRIRNLAFCATKAALMPVPNIERPASDDPDLFIWAMTHKLRTLVEDQS